MEMVKYPMNYRINTTGDQYDEKWRADMAHSEGGCQSKKTGASGDSNLGITQSGSCHPSGGPSQFKFKSFRADLLRGPPLGQEAEAGRSRSTESPSKISLKEDYPKNRGFAHAHLRNEGRE